MLRLWGSGFSGLLEGPQTFKEVPLSVPCLVYIGLAPEGISGVKVKGLACMHADINMTMVMLMMILMMMMIVMFLRPVSSASAGFLKLRSFAGQWKPMPSFRKVFLGLSESLKLEKFSKGLR